MTIIPRRSPWLILMVATVTAAPAAEQTFDGLNRVNHPRVDALYLAENVDWTDYRQVILQSPEVAIAGSGKGSNGLAASDIVRVRTTVSDLFLDVFGEALAEAGYHIAAHGPDQALLVRPRLVNLDLKWPSVPPGREARDRAPTVRSAILVLELFDAASGAIMARAIDRQRARQTVTLEITDSAGNRREARRVFRIWAGYLVDGLDAAHGR